MGEFSMLCHECNEGITNDMRDDGWMNMAVAIMADGQVIAGIHDGYGRLTMDEEPITPRTPLNPFGDDDPYFADAVLMNTWDTERNPDGRGPTVYHFACWIGAGKPIEYLGESPSDPEQGWKHSSREPDYPPCPSFQEVMDAEWDAMYDQLFPPTCDECGALAEDTESWCGSCGCCEEHCQKYTTC